MREKINLDIGCGNSPREKCYGLDIRTLPNVDFVCSAIDLSQFENNQFPRVFSKDTLEHISFWDVPKTLKEWLRVAELELTIQTPDARTILKLLEYPQDSRLRMGEESDFQYFSRIVYGHQDYPENCHKCYFTPEWLKDLLYVCGAVSAKETECSTPWSFSVVAIPAS